MVKHQAWKVEDVFVLPLIDDSRILGLHPWDAWHDPNYMDGLLLHPGLKPHHRLVYKSRE